MFQSIVAYYAKRQAELDPLAVEFGGNFLHEAFKQRREHSGAAAHALRLGITTGIYVITAVAAFLLLGCFALILFYLWKRVSWFLNRARVSGENDLPYRVCELLDHTRWRPKVMEELWLTGVRGSDLVKARHLEVREGQGSTPLVVHLAGCGLMLLVLRQMGWSVVATPDFWLLLPFILLLIWEAGWWFLVLQIDGSAEELDKLLARWDGSDMGQALARIVGRIVFLFFVGIGLLIAIGMSTSIAGALQAVLFDPLGLGRGGVQVAATLLVVWLLIAVGRRIQTRDALKLLQSTIVRADKSFENFIRRELQKDADWARQG